jgi:CBS domain-containing protein
MLEGHLHRVPVLEETRLVGIVTAMDLVRAIADQRLVESGNTETARILLP